MITPKQAKRMIMYDYRDYYESGTYPDVDYELEEPVNFEEKEQEI